MGTLLSHHHIMNHCRLCGNPVSTEGLLKHLRIRCLDAWSNQHHVMDHCRLCAAIQFQREGS
jgi:hypothetical protein